MMSDLWAEGGRVISDEQRQALTELTFRALDTIENTDADATLGDAILVFEIVRADGSTEGTWHSTSSRASVNIGMLTIASAVLAVERVRQAERLADQAVAA